MTASNRRLQLIRQVFAQREQRFAKRYGQFQHELGAAEQQLRQLRAHRDQHAAGMRDHGYVDPSRLQNRHAFHQRLNDAILQQEQMIEQARHESARLREQWMMRRRKTLSVDKLSDRRAEAALKAELKEEQKSQDERPLTPGATLLRKQ